MYLERYTVVFVHVCSEWPVYSGRSGHVRHADGPGGVLQAQRHRGDLWELGVFQTGKLFYFVLMMEIKQNRPCNLSANVNVRELWEGLFEKTSSPQRGNITHISEHVFKWWLMMMMVLSNALTGSSFISIIRFFLLHHLSFCPGSHITPPEWMQQTSTAEWDSWIRPCSSSRRPRARRARRASGRSST